MSRTRIRRLAVAAAAASLCAGLTQLPSPGFGAPSTGDPAATLRTPGDPVASLGEVDARGTALPTARQRAAASRLGAAVRWNDLGTPASIYATGGSLGRATSSDPATAARAWLAAHREVLGLSAAQVAALRLVNAQKLQGTGARAVLFRQSFGDLAPAIDSMVTVGVAGGRIVYVSSSLTRTTGSPAAPALSPVQGWLKAAASVGRAVPPTDLGTVSVRRGWSRFAAVGFAQTQTARTRSLALADGSVRPVVEADVVDAKGGAAFAYTVLVDAITGRVLWRHNLVDNSSDVYSFSGATGADGCGPKQPFETKDTATRRIVVTASTTPNIDIVLKLFGPDGQVLGSSDTATSPEVVDYAPGDTLPKGVYNTQVCLYDAPTVPTVGPTNYVGTVLTSDQGGPAAGLPFPPKWAYFLANPALDYSRTTVPGNRRTGCWVTRTGGAAVPGCSTPPGALENLAAAGPWDVDPRTHLPTFTTTGNAAVTHEAWADPLAPGGTAQAPYAPDRSYRPAFTDAWQNSGCDPTELHPKGNDIEASVTNLFVAHNRMHDFAYHLGFTERNYNLQQSNLGRNPDPTRENDPEVGNAQAGALSGGQPSYLGRDNANQIALQDGLPGITNQYLFQPIAGAFYSPCADGSFDMSIVGHEYTHAISNRMIGGPDEGITSEQGGAMGESWGDLTAGEYLFEHGYSTGANPWAVGPYATGNRSVGIRDYAI
ncbi:MAG: M36 family metallopeptidase, partial [Nocardioides sp.]